jgi:hypothetical protein
VIAFAQQRRVLRASPHTRDLGRAGAHAAVPAPVSLRMSIRDAVAVPGPSSFVQKRRALRALPHKRGPGWTSADATVSTTILDPIAVPGPMSPVRDAVPIPDPGPVSDPSPVPAPGSVVDAGPVADAALGRSAFAHQRRGRWVSPHKRGEQP